MRKILLAFALLQILDVVTTLVVLGMGGVEKNPLVALSMTLGPITGLLVAKLIIFGIAGIAAFLRKTRGLRLANLVFMGVVVWNITIIARLAAAA